MQLSPEASVLISQLRTFSDNKLTRENDLGQLIDLALRNGEKELLNNLSFYAKFVSRTYGIMKRIGRDGDGYDKLLDEFNENLTKASNLAQNLVSSGPLEVRQHFASTYFALTPEALDNLLTLFYNLSWYKNWLIDHQH
jgi:hypothetical protein